MNLFDIIKLDDIEFLKEIVSLYPETKLLAGPAEASPEGNQTLKDTALAYQVFDEDTLVHETAIEADRTFLSLILFKDVLNGERSKFPQLFDSDWEALSGLTHNIAKNSDDIELILYSLAAQDLGKTQKLVDEYKATFGSDAEDHDKLLAALSEERQDLFPGLESLGAKSRDTYICGLKGDLNLGQFVQGENLPCNLEKMMRLDPYSRDMRLLTELYDFAGVMGHVVPDQSVVMNHDNLKAYMSALASLKEADPATAYNAYIKQRGVMAGLTTFDLNLANDPKKIRPFEICSHVTFFCAEPGRHYLGSLE